MYLQYSGTITIINPTYVSKVQNNSNTQEYLEPTIRRTNVVYETTDNETEGTYGLYDSATNQKEQNEGNVLYDYAGNEVVTEDPELYDNINQDNISQNENGEYEMAANNESYNESYNEAVYDTATNEPEYDVANSDEYLKIMENNIRKNTDLHDHVNDFANKNNISIKD